MIEQGASSGIHEHTRRRAWGRIAAWTLAAVAFVTLTILTVLVITLHRMADESHPPVELTSRLDVTRGADEGAILAAIAAQRQIDSMPQLTTHDRLYPDRLRNVLGVRLNELASADDLNEGNVAFYFDGLLGCGVTVAAIDAGSPDQAGTFIADVESTTGADAIELDTRGVDESVAYTTDRTPPDNAATVLVGRKGSIVAIVRVEGALSPADAAGLAPLLEQLLFELTV